MEKIKKFIPHILGACAVVFLGVSIFTFIQIPSLEQKIIDKQESKAKIDAYLSQDHSNPVQNEEALAALDRPEETNGNVLYSYRTPEGFEMISYSKKWTENKLIELYEELKLNKHGEEFGLLYQVIVYAESSETAAGTHTNERKTLFLKIDLPALGNGQIKYYLNMGTIELYDGDTYTRVEQMAHTLSHEYGHHFTFYYFFKNGDAVRNSEYETVRNLGEHNIRYDWWEDPEDYLYNHHWYIVEIAAEDYVQIMGSPTAKKVIEYKDVRQVLYGSKYPDYYNSGNGTPQENLMIPLASEVEGLHDLFYQAIGEEYTPVPTLREKKNINLKITSGYSSHESVSGQLSFRHYRITWDDVYAGEGAIYTLVCYDEENYYIYPIKTVHSGDTMQAYIGTVSRETSTMIYWQYDELDQGTKTFIVTVLFPDGTMHLSDPLIYTFK